MIELVVTVCLLYEIDKCKQIRLTYLDVGMLQCVMGAQPEIAKWCTEHPRWYVKRWTCRMPRQDAEL